MPVASVSGGHSRSTTVDPRRLTCAIGVASGRDASPDAPSKLETPGATSGPRTTRLQDNNGHRRPVPAQLIGQVQTDVAGRDDPPRLSDTEEVLRSAVLRPPKPQALSGTRCATCAQRRPAPSQPDVDRLTAVTATCRHRPRLLLLGLSTYEEICLFLPVVSDLAQRPPDWMGRVSGPTHRCCRQRQTVITRLAATAPAPAGPFLKPRSALPDRLAGWRRKGGR
jgi:hypothetical protein